MSCGGRSQETLQNYPIVTGCSPAGWLKKFVTRRELVAPNAKPLFWYRVTEAEYQELRDIVAGKMPQNRHEDAMFCLFSAEWWRRYGESLTWAGILDEIGLEIEKPDLYDIVESGLRYWKRKVTVVSHGSGKKQRRFVGTLSREGGLPLQMLASERGSVSVFFSKITKSAKELGEIDIEAVREAGEQLPRSWRDPSIFELCVSILSAVIELSSSVGVDENPLARLETLVPDWKSRLPIALDHPLALSLVSSLLEDLRPSAGRSHWRPLCVETVLEHGRASWTMAKLVELPAHFSAAQVRRLLDLDVGGGLPDRTCLSLRWEGGCIPLAWITRCEGSDQFEVDPVNRSKVRVETSAAVQILWDYQGAERLGTILDRGLDLDAAPWIFAKSEDEEAGDLWHLVATGSAKLKQKSARVVLPTDASFQAKGEDSVSQESVVTTNGVERRVIAIDRSGANIQVSDECFTVSVGCQVSEAAGYSLEGQMLDKMGAAQEWLGVPEVLEQPEHGLRRKVADNELEWRPSGSRAEWNAMSEECLGSVVLRHRKGERVLFETRVKILPPDTTLEVAPGDLPGQGRLRVLGSLAASARVRNSKKFTSTEERVSDGYGWLIEGIESGARKVRVELKWDEQRSVSITVPFPVVGVRFYDHAGRTLPQGATIGISNLSRCRVESLQPIGARPPRVSACLRSARDLSRSFVESMEFSVPMHEASGRRRSSLVRYSLTLREIERSVMLRLSSSEEMNAQVVLSVQLDGQDEGVQVTVRRNAISLRVNDERDALVALPEKSEPFLEDAIEKISMMMMRVVSPKEVTEVARSQGGGRWPLPPNLDGVHLFVGMTGNQSSTRPVIFDPGFSKAEMDGEEGAFEAMQARRVYTLDEIGDLFHERTRKSKFLELLQRMVKTPMHPEWEHLMDYVGTLGTLPSTTFDALDAMVKVPESCVYALFEAHSEDRFARVWQGLQELAFSWDCVQLRQWRRGVKIWWARVRASLNEVEGERRKERYLRMSIAHYRNTCDRISAYLSTFSLISEFISDHDISELENRGQYKGFISMPVGQEILARRKAASYQELVRIQAHRHMRWPELRAIANLAHRVDEQLPRALRPLQKTLRPEHALAYQNSVMLGPAYCAIACALDWPDFEFTSEEIISIRRLKEFDARWFRECYTTTLAMAIGLDLQQKEKRAA